MGRRINIAVHRDRVGSLHVYIYHSYEGGDWVHGFYARKLNEMKKKNAHLIMYYDFSTF